MRPLLRRLPIRAKLVAMIMITSATVLVLAGVGYLAWDYFRLRTDMASELQAAGAARAREFGRGDELPGSARPRVTRWRRWPPSRACAPRASTTPRGALFARVAPPTSPPPAPPRPAETA